MKENAKWFILGAALVVSVWIHAWSTRYEWNPMVPEVLDRWTGRAYPGGTQPQP